MIGDIIISIVDFITTPVWHLVVFYVILLAFTAWGVIKTLGI